MSYTRSDGTKISVADALNDLYTNKRIVIYVGELNKITGNNGLVSTSFDIKNIQPLV